MIEGLKINGAVYHGPVYQPATPASRQAGRHLKPAENGYKSPSVYYLSSKTEKRERVEKEGVFSGKFQKAGRQWTPCEVAP
jgi:hypothetical protein